MRACLGCEGWGGYKQRQRGDGSWPGNGADRLARGHIKLLEGTALVMLPACPPPRPFLFSPLSLPCRLYRSRLLSLDSCQGAGAWTHPMVGVLLHTNTAL